jgi:hypothetical protein
MGYLARVPNPLLRSELSNRLAERLRVDDRLLRDELKRAAAESRGELRVKPEAAAPKPTVAERQLLRAVLESEGLADEILPVIVAEKLAQGMVTEALFGRLADARQQGEKLEVARLEEWAGDQGQRIAYASLFDAGEAPGREDAAACLTALRKRRIERERNQLQVAIEAAERDKNTEQLARLLQEKAKILKELTALTRA